MQFPSGLLFADIYSVATGDQLISAINTLNALPYNPSPSANTINLTATLSMPSDLPVIRNGVTVSGAGGYHIHGNAHRLFATYKASLALSHLTILNGLAQGGNGVEGGGGGLGAGGGVYVDLGQSLTLINSTISNCNAQGGNGGGNNAPNSTGGGGGASWTIGTKNASGTLGGGDNPGNISTGGGVTLGEGVIGYGGGAGGNGVNGKLGGAGGTSSSPAAGASGDANANGAAGGYCGGGGGAGFVFGIHIVGGGGGGGNGGGAGGSGSGAGIGKNGGGGGGYGSGGGGTVDSSFPSGSGGGGFGGGGGGSFAGGGGGGFGGGGGSGGINSSSNGGNGGYFGGNGSSGSTNNGGGGGAGIGGGIFVGDSATLFFNDAVGIASNLSNNTVTAGAAGGSGATSGSTLAPDIFLFKGASTQFLGAQNLTAGFSIVGDTTVGNIPDAGLVMNGAGTVTLGSTLNTYQGGLFLNSGILNISADTNLGTVPSTAATNITFNGGTLAVTATPVTINSNRGILLNSGGGTLQINTGTTTYGGVISGSGALTKTGAGTLLLSGTSTTTGIFTVSNGVLQAAATNILSSISALNMSTSATATFNLNNNSQTVGTLSGGTSGTVGNITLGSATLTVKQTDNATYGGVISGTGGLTLSTLAVDTLTLSNTNTYTGATTINGGTLHLTGTNAIFASSGVTLDTNGGANLSLGSVSQTIKSLSGGSAGGGHVFLEGGTLTIEQTSTTTYAGIISGSGGITKTGSGSLTLSGVSTYTGSTAISAGTITAGVANIFTNSSALTLSTSSAATFNLNNLSQTVATLSGGTSGTVGNITLGSATLAVNQTGAGTYGGIISGTGGLTLSSLSTNVLTLSNTNTYTGATTINGGTLRLNSTGTIATSSGVALANASGATLDLNNNSKTINNLSGGGTTGGNVTLGSGTLTITQNSNNSYSGVISGSGGISKAGTATLTLGGANAYTGPTAVTAGTLAASGENVNTSSGIAISGGATLNVIPGTASVTKVTSNAGTINITGRMTAANAITGAGAINVNSGGTLTLATGGGTISNTITNNASGNLAVAGTSTLATNLQNNGNMSITGSLNMPTRTLSNAGTISISGQNSLTAASYTHTNASKQIYNINSSSDYAQLTCVGCATSLNNSTLEVSIPTNATINGNFTIFSASSISGTPNIVGRSSLIERMVTINVGNTSINVTVAQQPVITTGITGKILNVLNAMNNNITNAGQQQLINAFTASNRGDLNIDLNLMIPISNALIYDGQAQSTMFNKIGARIASIYDEYKYPGQHTGINVGDLGENSAMWLSNIGNLAAQGPNQDNAGYNAKSGMFLLGMDMHNCNNTLGFAGGYSLSRVKEYSNANFINNIYRYHGLAYIRSNYNHNVFSDWLLSGNFNNNNAHRDIQFSGQNLSTKADYDGYLVAAKFTQGINCDFWESYRFVPTAFLQYVFLHQNSYNESGSVAALHVDAINKNILTLGLGARFNFPMDAWQLIGMRELRAAATYDVVNGNDVSTANFVVGSDSFTVVSTPARFGMLLGASITFEFMQHLQVELDYDFTFGEKFTDHTGVLKLKYVF